VSSFICNCFPAASPDQRCLRGLNSDSCCRFTMQ
jgi:hypothetical protein